MLRRSLWTGIRCNSTDRQARQHIHSERAEGLRCHYHRFVHCWPIIHRELQVAARRTTTYKQRLLIGAVASVVVVISTAFVPMSSTSGRRVFELLCGGGFVFCLLEGLRETADCLSRERREGTLGLLFLTELNGLDLALGKLTAAALKSCAALLAMFPAFMLPLWMGGVTGGECARMALTFAVTLFLSMTIGILGSALCTNALAGFAFAFLLFGFLIGVPIGFAQVFANIPWLESLAGPFGMFLNAGEAAFGMTPRTYWQGAIYSLFLSVIMLASAVRALNRKRDLETGTLRSSWIQRLTTPKPGFSKTWEGFSAASDPAGWLAERTLPGRKVLWLILGGEAVLCVLIAAFTDSAALGLLIGVQIVSGFMLKLWAAVVAPQSLHAAKRSGALEVILCTPLSPVVLVRGQIDALNRYFLGPALAVTFIPMFAGIFGAALAQNTAADVSLEIPMIFGMIWLVFFFLDLAALSYMGVWHGLTEPHIHQAIAKTVFRVLVLPWLTLVIPVLGMLGIFGWPIFWTVWGGGRLRKQFHDAASRLSVESEETGWLGWRRRKPR